MAKARAATAMTGRGGDLARCPLPVSDIDLTGLAGDEAGQHPAELIEPGQARTPVGANFAPPALGPGERLIRFAYRLGLSGAVLASPFRKPPRLRLLATVANPLPGRKATGTALRAGHFLVHGAKLPIAQVDFAGAQNGHGGLTPPALRLVHGFHWLADLEAAAPREQVAPVAEQILARWLAANPRAPTRPGQSHAWDVGNAGHRLLGWLVHAPLILSGGDKSLRAWALVAMRDTARWLDRNAARAEDGLARVAGWSAIVAAGLLLPDGRARLLHGEAGLIAALGQVLGDDGGVLSRSPLDQIEAIALLVRVAACYRATRRAVPEQIQAVLAMLVPPLLTLIHGDGALASWQGGWAMAADELAVLVEASGVRKRPLRQVRQWGYQRVAASGAILIFDAAPPPLAQHARHGCASTLAIEFSHDNERLLVNCGGAAAAGGAMPLRLEQGLRATAAHSTLVLDDANSTAVLANGALGAGVAEVEIDRRARAEADSGTSGARAGFGATRLEGSHDGYAHRYGVTHRRILILRDDGKELRGEDVLAPTKLKARRKKVAYALRFHLGPQIAVAVDADGQGMGLALADGSYWQFRAGSGDVTIEDSIWADDQGRPVAIRQLVVSGVMGRDGCAVAWRLQKTG